MRISDWSSDVCSSDLHVDAAVPKQQTGDDVIPVGRHIEGLHSSCRTLAEIAAHPALVTQECQRDALRLQVSDGRRKIVRSEERRVGKECGSTCRSRGSPDNKKKKKQK